MYPSATENVKALNASIVIIWKAVVCSQAPQRQIYGVPIFIICEDL